MFDPFQVFTEQANRYGVLYNNTESSVIGLHMFTADVMKNAYYICKDKLRTVPTVSAKLAKNQGDVEPLEDESISVFKNPDPSTNEFTIKSFVARIKEWVDDVKSTLENTVFGRLFGLIKCIFKEKLPKSNNIMFDSIGDLLDEWIGTPEELAIKLLGGSFGTALMAFRVIKEIYSIYQVGNEFITAFIENDVRKKWTTYGKATFILIDVILKVIYGFDLAKFINGEEKEEKSAWSNFLGLIKLNKLRKLRKSKKFNRRIVKNRLTK
jgi:hypothetical protein